MEDLINKGFGTLDSIKIENVFNRRNNNIISHPGSDDVISWMVTEYEYLQYKKHVFEMVSKIL